MIEAFRVRALGWATDTVRTLLAQLRGDGDIAADGVEVVQPAGLRARPPVTDTLEALVVELPNGDRVALAMVDKARAADTVEPEAGETQVHGMAQPGARMRLRADGSVIVESSSGATVTLDASGTVTVTASGGASVAVTSSGVDVSAGVSGTVHVTGGTVAIDAATVRVNGGVTPVALSGGPIVGTIATGLVMVPDPFTGLPTPNVAPVPVTGTIGAGAGAPGFLA